MHNKKKGKNFKKMIIAEELAIITMALERITQALTDDDFVREAESLDAECNRQRDRHHHGHQGHEHHGHRRRKCCHRGHGGRGKGCRCGRKQQTDQHRDDHNPQQPEATDENPDN